MMEKRAVVDFDVTPPEDGHEAKTLEQLEQNMVKRASDAVAAKEIEDDLRPEYDFSKLARVPESKLHFKRRLTPPTVYNSDELDRSVDTDKPVRLIDRD